MQMEVFGNVGGMVVYCPKQVKKKKGENTMEKEVTDEERGKVVQAVERNEALLELGFFGVPGFEMAEKTKKAKEMMKNAMSCLIQATISFQVLQVGNGEEKEEHIMALSRAQEFFGEKYKTVFGELETTLMVPEKK
jgi:hypothetical protein